MSGVRMGSAGLTSIILLSALVSGGAWWARGAAREKAQQERQEEKQAIATVQVTQQDFEVSVTVVGKLEAVKSTPVMAGVSGQVNWIIQNGSRVKKDDVIVELDSPRMAREVRTYANQYASAQEQLEKQKKDLAMAVERAQLSLTQSQQQLDQFKASQEADLKTKRRKQDYSKEELELTRERFARKQRQVKEALLPASELEAAEAEIKSKEFGLEREDKDLQLAEAQQKAELLNKERAVQQAQSELKRAQDAQQDEVRNLQARLQTAKQQLDRAQEQLSKATIRAPQDGIVVLMGQYGRFGRSQDLSVGDRVWEQMSVATIPDLTKMRVSLELGQEQVRRVKRGLKVRVQVETAPGQIFPGEVTEISQNAQEQSAGYMSTGERVFQTAVLLKDTKGAYLRPGTTSVATIIIERQPKALLLPLECVFDRDGKKIVYVEQKGDFRRAEVELGPQNEDLVVVKKGLRPGDRVAMHDMKGTGPGPTGNKAAAGLPL